MSSAGVRSRPSDEAAELEAALALSLQPPQPAAPTHPMDVDLVDEPEPATYGALYTHKSALDLIIEKEYIYFSGCGLTTELEAIRDRIIEQREHVGVPEEGARLRRREIARRYADDRAGITYT